MNPEQLTTELGERLASYRVARNLTQAEVATEAGVDRTTIARLEKGKGTLDTLARVMAALDISERLLDLIPGTHINPLDQLQNQGKQRQRVRKRPTTPEQPWSWGEDP